jgi:hypothetical protein
MLHPFMASGVYFDFELASPNYVFQPPHLFFPFSVEIPRLVSLVIILDVVILLID